MEKLPREIPSNIFSRLPFDTVMQCRCVSKSWYNLIQLLIHISGDLYLAKTHLNRLLEKNHHSSTTDSVLLLSIRNNHPGLHFVEHVKKTSEEHVKQTRYRGGQMIINKFNSPLTINPKFWTMASSSNGLICSAVYKYEYLLYRFYIYNPFLRQHVTLPKLKLAYHNSMALGFGYIPSTGEYKVVRIFYPLGRLHGDSTVGKVEVYTLGERRRSSNNSTHPCIWRSKGNIEHRLQVSSPGVLVNGSLHWLREKVVSDDQKVKLLDILAFDLLEEEFYSVPLPPSEYLTNFQIKELGGCLCGINKSVERRMQMWIMEDYPMKKKKTKESFWNWKSVFKIKWKALAGFEECLHWNKTDQALLWYNSSSLVQVDCIFKPGSNPVGKDSYWPPRVFHGLSHIKSFVSLKALGEDNVITVKTEKIRKRKRYLVSGTKTKRSR